MYYYYESTKVEVESEYCDVVFSSAPHKLIEDGAVVKQHCIISADMGT